MINPPVAPETKDPVIKKYLTDLNLYYARELQNMVRTNQAVRSIHLQSPADKVFEVTVADDGTLTTTLVRG